MRLRHLVARKAGVVFPLQAIKHANIAHREGQAGHRFGYAGWNHAPTRCFIPRLNGRQQPGQRAEGEQGGGGRRKARPFIQQILEGRAGFDAQNIRIGVFRRAAKMQPKPIRYGAHPVRTRHLQIWLGDGLTLTRAGTEPGCALTGGCTRRALRPGFQPGTNDIVETDGFAVTAQSLAHNTNYPS